MSDRLRGGAAVWALARPELAGLLWHPFLVGGAVVSGFLAWSRLWGRAAVLPLESVWLAGAVLPVAGAGFLLAAWVGGRARRNRVRETVDALPHPRWVEPAAQLALVVVPLCWAGIVEVGGLVYAWTGAAVGSPRWSELIGGLLVVVTLWFGGVALGRAVASGVVPVLTLLVLTYLHLISSPDAQISDSDLKGISLSKLALWIPPSIFDTPEQVVLRPSGFHVGFLVSVATAAGFLAVRRDLPAGWLGRAEKTVGASLGVLVLVLGNLLVRQPETPRVDWSALIAAQPCRDIDGVEYCVFDMYQGWVDDWRDTLTAVGAVAPIDVTRVVQRPEHTTVGGDIKVTGPGVVLTGTAWDRPGGLPVNRFELAVSVGLTAVGMTVTGDGLECVAEDQGRSILPLWAAAVAVERGDTVLAGIVDRSGAGPFLDLDSGNTALGVRAAEVAIVLAERPTDQITARFEKHPTEIRDPATSVEAMAEWFGIDVAPAPMIDNPFGQPTCP